MDSITSLSPDILGLILYGRSSSYLLINLWKCGDRKLNEMLSKSVVYVHLSDYFKRSNSRWPKLLSELRQLRYLSIDRSSYPLKNTLSELSAEIQRLPPSLTTLKLQFANVHLALLNCDSTPDNSIKTQYERGLSRLVDMNRLLPRLQTLKLFDKPKSAPIEFADFAGLPDGLTSLSTRAIRIFDNNTSLTPLPRSLTELKAKVTCYDNKKTDFSVFPLSLTYIKRLKLPLAHLPAHIRVTEILPFDRQIVVRPSTTHLAFAYRADYNVHQPWSSVLPPNLTVLELNHNFELTEESLSLLPATLLCIGKFPMLDAKPVSEEPQNAKFVSLWPPRLETLAVRCRPDCTSLLPKTLTELRAMLDPDWNHSTLPLHHGLQSLFISSSIGFESAKTFFDVLPASLTDLNFTWVPTWVKREQSPLLQDNFAPTSIRRLSSLKHFCIDLWTMSWLPLLPRSITNLYMSALICEPQEILLEDNVDPFAQIPSDMQYLTIIAKNLIPETGKLPAASFSSLKRLRALQIQYFPQLPRSFWKTLPRMTLLSAWVEDLEDPQDSSILLPNTCSTVKSTVPSSWLSWKSPKHLETSLRMN